MKTTSSSSAAKIRTPYCELPFWKKVGRDIVTNPMLYLMFLPVLAFYILFCYKPMYGALIAFMDYVPGVDFWDNDWIGFENFVTFFHDRNFGRVIKNTLVISFATIIFGFPAPIILALLLNELKSRTYSRVVQTISYMPHFISLVVVCGLIKDFTSNTGILTQFFSKFGFPEVTMLSKPDYFVPLYVISGIWQEIGYGSIIYLAALTGIGQELYEAARIDGANKWQQTINVTLPGIVPTIMTMLIMRLGNIMTVGHEKILLLYNSQIYETSDVISTYIYRKGLLDLDFGYSTAIGLFNSAINLAILLLANALSKKASDTSLW